MLPTLLLRLDVAVPGRSYSSGAFLPERPLRAVDGRRPASNGPGTMVFIRCKRFVAGFFGLAPGYAGSTSYTSGSAKAPYPPGRLIDCPGGESPAIRGEK